MNIIIVAIIIFAVSIILFSFINFKIGISLYIAYLVLVPYLKLPIGGADLSFNVVNILLLVGFLYNYKIRRNVKIEYKIVIPFLCVFIALTLLSFFETDVPLSFQLDSLRVEAMKICIVSFVIWNVGISDPDSVIYIKWSIIISFIIAGIYGVYLMGLGGQNPYTTYITDYFGIKFDAAKIYANKTMVTRLSFSSAAKIQSTTIHPMTWAMQLCYAFILFFTFLNKEKKTAYILLLLLVAFNLLTSGVRTGLVALVIAFAYFIIRTGRFKTIGIGLIAVLLGYFIIDSVQDFHNIYDSITNVNSTTLKGGSTIPLRLRQFQGALDEVRGEEWVGKGYGWTVYYELVHGDHPVLLAFESLVFVLLCDGGVLGICIWIIFYISIFRLNRKLLTSKVDILIMDMMMITYLAYTIGTGDYDFVPIFVVYYTFLMVYLKGQDSYNLKKGVRLFLWTTETEQE